MKSKCITTWGKGLCMKVLITVLFLPLFLLPEKASATFECNPSDQCHDQCDYCVSDDPPNSITQAITQADEGATICVAPGTYSPLSITKNITLRSCNGQGNQDPENTTIFNYGASPVFIYWGGLSVVIEGFTIKQDYYVEAGVGCSEMGPCGGGGGIYIGNGASATINNCIIRNNFGGLGGGISCDGCSSTTVMNSIIKNNGGLCAGGIGSQNGSIKLINTVIKGNLGCWGGGLMSYNDNSLELINSTVKDNEGTSIMASGGICLFYPTSLSMVNSIVWGNSTFNTSYYGAPPQQMQLRDGDYYSEDYSSIHISHSNVQTTNPIDYHILEDLRATQCSVNISSDPEFIDGFHLDRSSRSIDVGDNAAPDLPALDKDGDQRIINGNLLSNRSCDADAVVDMGADEAGACDPNLLVSNFELDPPAGTLKVNPFIRTEVWEPLTVQFTDTSTGNVTDWKWDFGDGTTSTEQNPSHSYYGPVDQDRNIRDYTVSLRVCENCLPCDETCVNSDKRTVNYAVHITDLPQLVQIEPEGPVHRGQEIRIIGYDFDDARTGLGDTVYMPDDPTVRSVNIGDYISYSPNDPNIISWTNCQIIAKVPNYPESEFQGSDSMIKDVSVTMNKYYTSNNAPARLEVTRVFCGDGFCSDTETCYSCEQDCDVCPRPVCGDGFCSSIETCSSCEQDCGVCPTPVCGDGVCNGSETCWSCDQDCGQCIYVSKPKNGATLQGGSTYKVTLRIIGLPETFSSEVLRYKCDTDNNWRLIKSLPCCFGSCPTEYPWVVPLVGTTKTGCKVRARILDSSGNILAQDKSNGYFTISP